MITKQNISALGKAQTKSMKRGKKGTENRRGDDLLNTHHMSESLQMVIAAMKLKDAYFLEGKLWPT